MSNEQKSSYEQCGTCGAPLEASQRYCVNCAARRPDADNPATQYLAAGGARRSRAVAGAPVAASARKPAESPSSRLAAVVFFALLPIAVGVGILVGRSGNDDSKLLDALKNVQGTAVASTNPGDSGALTGNTGSVSSDFSLDKGYVVKLDLLPVEGTDQSAVDAAKKDAEDNGASDVGVINPSDFTTTPDQGQKDYVLYSGEFKTKAEATKALGKLKKDFSDAEVIEVVKPSTTGDPNKDAAPTSPVLAHTSHGDVHKVAGTEPTKEQADAGAQIAQQQANQTGKDYIEQQQGLPDVIVIGGDPDSAPDPTGSGD
jgi:hypothetical protein